MAEVVSANEQSVVRLTAPFASQEKILRVTIDRKLSLNLAAATSFTIQVMANSDQIDTRVSLYFHSDKGWYSGGTTLTKSGWRTLTFAKDAFSSEENPAEWNKIDQIRISIWRPKNEARDTSFDIKQLEAHWNNTAIIIPPADSPEFKATEAVAKRIAQMLLDTGIGSDLIKTDSLRYGSLGNRPIAILPHNPRLDPATLASLDQFVTQGGKILTCYSMSPELGKTLGFKNADYFYEKKSGDFASVQFDNKKIPGMPGKMRQASWNIKTAEPGGHNARVIGHWLDADGNSTGKSAMLISDRGAYFSHIILGDDQGHKKAMLIALLGQLSPQIWKEAADNILSLTEKIGHCQSIAELEKFVANKPGSAPFSKAKILISDAKNRQKKGNGYGAFVLAGLARILFTSAYLDSQASPTVEARAFWNHSGTGAYPGDWDRTAREMSAGGLNMILPNMLWGGVAHYPSDILPHSKTFEDYGDQIQQCIKASHQNGIEVHVWKVNYNLGHSVPKEFVQKLRDAGRLQVDVNGEPGDWLNPAHPENFKLELESILEVVRNYDIDGFHFDYIRYPNSRNDFSDYSRKKFEADTGNKVKNWPADCYDGPLLEAYTDWRCAQITKLVKAVSEQARVIRPGIKISAAVFRDYPKCRQWVAQDWPLWAKEGYVDFLCPMDYTDNDEKYLDWITTQKSLLPKNFPLYPGIGASLRNKTQSADRVVGQIYLNRKVGTGGFTIFNLNEDTLQSIAKGMSIGAGKNKATPPHAVKK